MKDSNRYAEIAAEEREQCCKDVCALCAKGRAVERFDIGNQYDVGKYDWRHPDRERSRGCWAYAIRERAYQQELRKAAQ